MGISTSRPWDPEVAKTLKTISKKIELTSLIGFITSLLVTGGSIAGELVIGGQVFILLAGLGIFVASILGPLALVNRIA